MCEYILTVSSLMSQMEYDLIRYCEQTSGNGGKKGKILLCMYAMEDFRDGQKSQDERQYSLNYKNSERYCMSFVK